VLITAEIEAHDGLLGVPKEALEATRAALSPNSSVVLPGMWRDRFFVLVDAQQESAGIVADAFWVNSAAARNYDRKPYLHRFAQCSLPTGKRRQWSMATFTEEVASEVRDHINYVCLQGES
jgi:hypothetical protein